MIVVDENVRRNFESDWRRGSPGDIADYLPEPDDPSYLATLEELVCIDLEFRWREFITASGNLQDSANAPRPCIEDYLDRFSQLKSPAIVQRLVDQEIWVRKDSSCPASSEELQHRFPELGLPSSTVHRRLRTADVETLGASQVATLVNDRAVPRFVGGYEVLDLLGRGGMGMVYKARQLKADRLVALKLTDCSKLPSELRPEMQRRFESEVRAAAKLSHDNLMPIYDVGEASGCLFYTMPIVDGDLAAELRNSTLAPERAARYIAQAARGVAVAHAQGLLHRDIKPQNLMLDRQQDRVLVADFGLARLAEVDQQLTRTGDVVGTPPYMAPEQIRDPRAVDARGDVYALGATLYCLLVGRPPFQAATVSETLRQVLDEDPISPRLLNPDVDRDLETICLRCLQKDRQLRFASAGELADDLERYLRGEPIVSRPLGIWGRLDRWRRRNPVVASLAGALAAALVLIAVVASWGWYSTQRQFSRFIGISRQDQANLNQLFTDLRNEPLLNQPGQEAIHRYLLEFGLKNFQSLAALAKENKELSVDLLAARKELALLSLDLEGPDAAADQLRRVIAAAANLPRKQQQSLAVQETLGDCYNGLGQAQHELGMEKEALAAFQKAIEIRRGIVGKAEKDSEARRKLANALMNQGLAEAALGNTERSRSKQEDAQRERRLLLAGNADDSRLLRDVAQGEFNLARLDLMNGNPKAGVPRLRDATKAFERLARDNPNDARIWLRYIESLLTLIVADEDAAQLASSSELHRRSVVEEATDDLQALSLLAPKNRTYRIQLVDLYQQAIELLLAAQLFRPAETSWRTVQTKLIDNLEGNDTNADAIRVRLTALRQRGLISLGMGQNQAGKAELQRAIDAWHAVKDRPEGRPLSKPEWEADWVRLELLAKSLPGSK